MSVTDTYAIATGAIEDYLGLKIAKDLGGDRVMFREVDTGRFAFATNVWTYFRENYEELRAHGAFG